MSKKPKGRRGGIFSFEVLEERRLFTAVPVDGTPVTLTGVKPGDTVSIQATITTATDPNENGEGEPLVITSTSGFSASDGNFNVTTGYTFTAGVNDEVITASFSGADGDEDGSVDATFSSTPNTKYTPAQKTAYAKLSADLAIAAAGTGTVAGALGFGPPPWSQGVAAGTWVTAGVLGVASAYYNRLSLDPPDPNFTAIAHPAPPKPSALTPVSSLRGLKAAGAVAAAMNALELNQQRSLNLSTAEFTTANRIDGANAAGNTRWAKIQGNVLKAYKRQQALLLAAQPGLLSRQATQFAKAGLGTTAVSSSDVQAFEQSVVSNGLPADMVTALNKLGVDAATQSQIQQALFVQDTTVASGTYQSILTNPSLQADINQAFLALRGG